MLARAIGIPVGLVLFCRLIADVASTIAREEDGPGWLPLMALAAGGAAGLLGGFLAGLLSARASMRDALFGWLAISSLAGLLILLADAVPRDGRLLFLVIAVVLTSNLGFAIPGILAATRIRRTWSRSRSRPNGGRS